LVGEHHVVSGLESVHFPADLLHNAGALMPQHDRAGKPALTKIDVGVADPTGHDAHQQLILTRAFHVQGLNLQRCARLAQYGCSDRNDGRDPLFHVFTPLKAGLLLMPFFSRRPPIP